MRKPDVTTRQRDRITVGYRPLMMEKTVIRFPFRTLIPALVVAGAMAALPAQAQFAGPGTTSRGGTVTTVAEAAEARSDTRVVLEGHIIAHQFDDYYIFKDQTGTITAEIERHAFRRQTVTPDTKVRLHGEVDRGIRGRYIEVDRLEIIQ